MATNHVDIRAFYGGFHNRLLLDYVSGNPRSEAAIGHALRSIPVAAHRILDLGCGIGWSTREFGRRFREAQVVGIDLSPELVKLAQRLTTEPNVRYLAQDITESSLTLGEKFDAIVLLDVYEHIPVEERAGVHLALRDVLEPHGVVILTCPTPEHQNYLRQHAPEGLQLVDEDVDEQVVAQLAKDVGGGLALFRRVCIWHPNDYSHIVITRNQAKCAATSEFGELSFESLLSKVDRVRQSLNVQMLPTGLVLSESHGPVILIAAPEFGATTETFIKAHVQRLPAKVRLLHGSHLHLDEFNQPVLPKWRRRVRLLRRSWYAAQGLDEWQAHAKGIAWYLEKIQARAVLAEYGPTGVRLLEACKLTGLPLVVHFHGFDAYSREVLGQLHEPYLRLFEQAAAIIAVSNHMREQLIRLGAPGEKVHLIPYGVDLDQFGPCHPDLAPKHFLAVGRFVEKKAPHLTLVAFQRVLAACPDARLTIIGGGPLLPVCRQLARALGIDRAIDFRGPQEHDRVAATMRNARAFVQHSVEASNGDCEGTPVAILEAQAAGLPVVSTRHTGINEAILEGKTGYLVDEQDVETMALRMTLLAKDPQLAGRLGMAGRARVHDEFNMQNRIAQLHAIIAKVALG